MVIHLPDITKLAAEGADVDGGGVGVVVHAGKGTVLVQGQVGGPGSGAAGEYEVHGENVGERGGFRSRGGFFLWGLRRFPGCRWFLAGLLRVARIVFLLCVSGPAARQKP